MRTEHALNGVFSAYSRLHGFSQPSRKSFYYGRRIGEINMFDKICLILVIIGALNWGLVGLFEFDLVAWAFGGATAIISRIIYTVIALAGIWCISLLFKERATASAE